MAQITSSQCETCQRATTEGGDWVPYGSSGAHLPEYTVCGGWEGDPQVPFDLDVEKLAEEGKCPAYLPLPKCKKHPEEFMDSKYGCNKCFDDLIQKWIIRIKI